MLRTCVQYLALKRTCLRRQNGKAKDVLDDIHQEIELMSSLSHVNIVQYRGAEVNRPACELMIFQEWCATTAKHSSPRAASARRGCPTTTL